MQATTSFQTTVRLPSLDNLSFPVDIAKGQNIKDLCHYLCEKHEIPPYLLLSLYSAILSIMAQLDSKASTPTAKTKNELKHLFMNSYQANTLQYNNKPEEDIFPRAYHTLVHCPIAHIFDTLLELEQSYAVAIQELQATGEQEFQSIQARQALEIESTSNPSSTTNSPTPSSSSGNNMTTIFTRQVEEMELFQATWQSDIMQTQQTQRQEYREFVVELYKEYQSRVTLPNDELKKDDIVAANLDGKEIVATAASRVKQWDHQEGSVHSGDSKASRKRTGSFTSSIGQSSTVEENPSVKNIQEMGFEKEQAETALVLSNQNMESAISLLLENPAKVDTYIQQQQQQRTYRRSQSLSQVPRPNLSVISPSTSRDNRRHSLQKLTTTPTFLNIMSPKQQKSWNPISFLQQQKQNMENTNLSSMRKLSGWLGKAMENFGIEHDVQQQQQTQLVESFTIMMGTNQIKSSHNLRLLVSDITEIFNPMYDTGREMAYRAETATKLYTSHLSAHIVLVELNELTRKKRQYKFGKGSNKPLFERCQQSTEFHFGDIESQIVQITDDLEGKEKEGAFFITKHSNLPSTQVVFHLFIDSSNVTTHDLSNRHALIIGLRNILKMTTQFDISSISIPLLLLPDRFSEKRDSVWLQKRGEVVMKCVKGFLMENSQSGKRNEDSMAGGGMRNIEFLLPIQPHIYSPSQTADTVTHNDLPQEVQVAFQQFRALLVNLFRTS